MKESNTQRLKVNRKKNKQSKIISKMLKKDESKLSQKTIQEELDTKTINKSYIL